MRLDIDSLTIESFDTALPGDVPISTNDTEQGGPDSRCSLCIPSANTTC
jgi:hypothetical protein